ncbi:MAG: peptide-methionine (S)-S-oxide reductase [Chloroflexi bacterium RBG_16_54_18]|nr:MAG: peptide-methionine (S)-S-oxide reductase [Chloroflexi bacterium RBG_16_54_18]
MEIQSDTLLETITLGGGCFWCLEAVFDQLDGIEDVVSGYAGGSMPDPDYQMVCSGNTGHAEVVQLNYNPGVIGIDEIFEVFFSIHDPTTLNRQGADIGTQYRSVIFYHSEEQKVAARKFISEIDLNKVWNSPLVTQLEPIKVFYPAEDYHQNYFEKNPYQGYCRAVIAPKLSKFRSKFSHRLKD